MSDEELQNVTTCVNMREHRKSVAAVKSMIALESNAVHGRGKYDE
ncbi:MAG: hypothetical protein PW844_12000 [Pantoea sp.]|nr:hypothetical protein [Pantoea sp.]MDE1187183.1 hypothetical protein [Pantoea sp.]